MRLPLLAGFLVLTSLPTAALAQVEPCRQKMSAITDGRLQAAVDALRAKFPGLAFQADDACDEAKYTTRALTKTLGRNFLKRFSGFEYVKIVDGEHYFTLDRFQIPKAAQRKRLDAALKKCVRCKLKIPENTCLAHFVAGDSVVLMIAAAAGCKKSLEKLQQVEQAFTAKAEPLSPP